MKSLLLLLKRYWLPREGQLMSFALWISGFGVALGVVQLMVVLAVMSGFVDVLEDHYRRITSPLIIRPNKRELAQPDLVEKLRQVPGIAAITPVAMGPGMVMKKRVGGVMLEGVERKTVEQVTPLETVWVTPPRLDLEAKNPFWIWLGKQLADKLQVKVGDSVDVLVADTKGRRVVPFVVTAITKFGIYEHDLRYARIDLNVLNEIFRRNNTEPFYKTRIKPGVSPEEVKALLTELYPREVSAYLWSDYNTNVFKAVRHQKQLLFLILQIIVMLAALNVVNLLLMSAHYRKKDVGILRAMGMRRTEVTTFFVLQGGAVGVLGVVGGIVAGWGVCEMVSRFQPELLSEAVYNVTRLPIDIRGHDIGLIALCGLALCVIFSIIPAVAAAVTKPGDALRYE